MARAAPEGPLGAPLLDDNQEGYSAQGGHLGHIAQRLETREIDVVDPPGVQDEQVGLFLVLGVVLVRKGVDEMNPEPVGVSEPQWAVECERGDPGNRLGAPIGQRQPGSEIRTPQPQ